MTKKIFTDETGEKFAFAGETTVGIFIKPIKQVEKRKYKLQFWELGKVTNIPIAEEFDLTEPTAIAISEAIKSLIELIQATESDWADFNDGRHNAWNAIIEARIAYQAERSEADGQS